MFTAKRLYLEYDSRKMARNIVTDLLAHAAQVGILDTVAQYIVGAMLELQFRNISINNEYNNRDDLSAKFEIGNTIFYVTAILHITIYEKCKSDIVNGKRVYILVPEDEVYGTQQNARFYLDNVVTVKSIESFVGQGLDELSAFSENNLRHCLRKLFDTYNKHVIAIGNEKSHRIVIPANL